MKLRVIAIIFFLSLLLFFWF